MDNELLLKIKPQFFISSALFSSFMNAWNQNKKLLFLLFIFLFVITIPLCFLLDLKSIAESCIWGGVGFVTFFTYIFAMSVGYKEKEYKATCYKVYTNKLVIQKQKAFDTIITTQELETKYISDIIITSSEIQKQNNIATITFVADELANLPNLVFEDIYDSQVVYDTVKPYIDNNEYISFKNDDVVMIMVPKLTPLPTFYNLKLSNNKIHDVLAKTFLLGVIIYGICALVYTIESLKNIFNYTFPADVIIFITVILSFWSILTFGIKKQLLSTSYLIYQDRIEVSFSFLFTYQSQIIYISDIKNVELLQSSVQAKNNVGNVWFELKNQNSAIKYSTALTNVENPAFVYSKIKQLKEH
ncbi:hypothetical protein IJ182_06945 [bacterium]|nr:hypothetical protein [bacterium]